MAGLPHTALLLLTVAALQCSSACADEPLDSVLESWVAGARNIERPSIATAQARYGEELSRHQLEAAVFLWTPDSVDSLKSRFAWSFVTDETLRPITYVPLSDPIEDAPTSSQAPGHILLSGSPISDVDRAFIGTVAVFWNTETHHLESIHFAGEYANVRFANVPRASDAVIQQAAYYPPAEDETENAATGSDEVQTASAVLIDEGDPFVDEISRILERWAAASANGDEWELLITSSDVNHVFASETQFYVLMRGDGQETIEVRWDPVVVDPDAVNPERLTPDGTPYRLQPGPAMSWVFTPEFAIFANPISQTMRRTDSSMYDSFPWYRHPRHTPSCMTFYLPVNADELAARYQWEVESRDENSIRLRGIPSDSDVAASVSLVEIELGATNGLPRMIRCVDSSGSHEHIMQVVDRSRPTGLTRELILGAYSSFGPAPEKPNQPR